jgi:cell division protein FtsB
MKQPVRIISLRWILLPLLALLQYEIWLAPGGVISLWRVQRQLAAEMQTNLAWQQRNQLLMADVEDLKDGTQAIEDHARTDLGMIKPGEILYQLP